MKWIKNVLKTLLTFIDVKCISARKCHFRHTLDGAAKYPNTVDWVWEKERKLTKKSLSEWAKEVSENRESERKRGKSTTESKEFIERAYFVKE